MRAVLAFPFRLIAALFLLASKGSSRTADAFVSVASFIDPQEHR